MKMNIFILLNKLLIILILLLINYTTYSNAQDILVVSNIHDNQWMPDSLAPLMAQWENEGFSYKLIDIDSLNKYSGRDDAERFRSFLQDYYRKKQFHFLFLIDIVYEDNSYEIPIRFFYNQDWWNDLYYSFLFTDFDFNNNNNFADSIDDIDNLNNFDKVLVGRLILYAPDVVTQLRRYIQSNIQFRKGQIISHANLNIYRDYESIPDLGIIDGWTSEFVDSLSACLNFQNIITDKMYNLNNAEQVREGIDSTDLVIFLGHGNYLAQQIGWIGPLDSQGYYLLLNNLINFNNVSRPSIVYFGGCECGDIYLSNSCARKTISCAPLIYADESSKPAVAVIANTGLGNTFALTFTNILREAFKSTYLSCGISTIQYMFLSNEWPFRKNKVVNKTQQLDFPFHNAFSFQLLGDPTIPYKTVSSVPVEFINFTGIYDNKENLIILEWKTASETNNYGFEIEKRNTFDDFYKIGFVEGAGTINYERCYIFKDKDVAQENSYFYRVKQVDYDGKYTYSKTIEISIPICPWYKLFQNYPNSFNSQTIISFELEKTAEISISIFNLKGQMVDEIFNGIREPGYHTINWDAGSVSAGMYIIKMEVGDFIRTKKCLILK